MIQIFQDRAGSMWFCTYGGVSRLDRSGGTFTNFTRREGMNAPVVQSMTEDKRGNFWFGTRGGGINVLDLKHGTLRHLGQREGLADNTIYGMLEDKHGNMVISTATHLNVLSEKELERMTTSANGKGFPVFQTYTPEMGNRGTGDGLYYLVEAQNRLWVPKRDRIVVFYPGDEPEQNLRKPHVELTGLKLFDEPVAWENTKNLALRNGFQVHDYTFDGLAPWSGIPDKLSLAHDNNYLRFDFAGINVSSPRSVRYQYRLAGLSDQWGTLTSEAEATYGNLSPGAYTFQVRARSGSGPWSDALSYTFQIRSPWWQKWWMVLLYLCVTAGIGYVFIRYRIRMGLQKMKAMEAIRTKISADLHDDVGSILSGLAMQSEMMAITAKDDDGILLNELSVMSREAMERMRDTVWTIDSRKDKYENLVDRMRDFAERTLGRKHIHYDFVQEVEDGKKFLAPERRQHIYFIFTEAVTNVVKHSGATHALIAINIKNNSLRMCIQDNGMKINAATPAEGLGLTNMKMRASQIGGYLDIGYEQGFKVELKIGR